MKIDQVIASGYRARDLVKQILAFARQAKTERRPLPVHLIAKEALKMLRASLPSTISINNHVYPAANVMADPTHIHQIIMNLCTNAAHAMKDGGALTVALANETIGSDHLNGKRLFPPGAYVCLSVSDTGHGMTPEVLEKIFDPYFTTKEKGEGTGLGLAVVHGIVHDMNGEIVVDSTPGEGTTVRVYLPGIEAESKSEALDAVPVTGGKERILLVDDEITIVKINIERLAQLGYQVTACTSSLDALNRFKAGSQGFDLVITDLTMPGMTGLALAKEIHEIRSDIPVILCTGYSKSVSEADRDACGIDHVMDKPVLAHELARKVREALEIES